MLDAAGLSVVGAAEDIIDDLEYLHDLDTVKKYVSADGAFSSPGGLLDPSGCLTLTLTLFLSLSLSLSLTLTLTLTLTPTLALTLTLTLNPDPNPTHLPLQG